MPRLRKLAADKARPKLRDIWSNLKGIASSPRKLVLLLGGSFAQELLVAMALSVSLRAFDDHLRLPVLIVVIMLAATMGGVSPTPGGLGVVEAGMILGLTAAGVSEADATAAVFIQRLFSSYLPPIWGWATLVLAAEDGTTCERRSVHRLSLPVSLPGPDSSRPAGSSRCRAPGRSSARPCRRPR